MNSGSEVQILNSPIGKLIELFLFGYSLIDIQKLLI